MAKEAHAEGNGAGAIAVIFGILSIFPGSFFPIIGVVFGIIGLIFGIVQYRSSSNKWAKWGIALSAIGIVLSVFFFIIAFKFLSNPALAQQLPGLSPS